MIVVISSAIFPSVSNSLNIRSVFSPAERLTQTIETIKSLLECGYNEIYLFDNSGKNWKRGTEEKLYPAKVFVFNQHQFRNKGISETLMLINGLDYLPENKPILKISGRYKISGAFSFIENEPDISAKFYIHKYKFFSKRCVMATRCYILKDKAVFDLYLNSLLEEMYAYSYKIIGIGSFKRFIFNQFFSSKNTYLFSDPILSVEAASVRVIKRLKLRIYKMDKIGLSGYAGTFINHLIED